MCAKTQQSTLIKNGLHLLWENPRLCESTPAGQPLSILMASLAGQPLRHKTPPPRATLGLGGNVRTPDGPGGSTIGPGRRPWCSWSWWGRRSGGEVAPGSPSLSLSLFHKCEDLCPCTAQPGFKPLGPRKAHKLPLRRWRRNLAAPGGEKHSVEGP